MRVARDAPQFGSAAGAVECGAFLEAAPEPVAEVERILESHLKCDLLNGVGRERQKLLGAIEAVDLEELLRRRTGLLTE